MLKKNPHTEYKLPDAEGWWRFVEPGECIQYGGERVRYSENRPSIIRTYVQVPERPLRPFPLVYFGDMVEVYNHRFVITQAHSSFFICRNETDNPVSYDVEDFKNIPTAKLWRNGTCIWWYGMKEGDSV